MTRFLISIFILCIYACSGSLKNREKIETKQEHKIVDTLTNTVNIIKSVDELKFTETNGQAVLIGDKIELLNNKLETIDVISNLTGKIVDIKGVSDSLFNQSKDICKSFWFVNIQTEKIKGIVNGRQVFEIQNSNQDTIFSIDGNQFEILTTDFLGMGVDYDGDLMGCPVDQPILIKDKKNSYFGLVNLIINEYSKKASWDNNYPYFEIRADDGCYDKIISIISNEKYITLKIHREWQEGTNDFEVQLSFDGNKYFAEYLNFGEIVYE